MEPLLFQDSLWFLAAVLWQLAALGTAWPRPAVDWPRASRWGWWALCSAQAISAISALFTFDGGDPVRLVAGDWWCGAALLTMAIVGAVRPGWRRTWWPDRSWRWVMTTGGVVQVVAWPAFWLSVGVLPKLRVTDFLPWGLARSLLALALGLGAFVVVWRARPAPKHRRRLVPIWLALVLVAGVGLAEWVAAVSRRQVVDSALTRARSLALALDGEAIDALTIGQNTPQQAAYKTLRAQLRRLRQANRDVAYLYLTALHDGHVVYPVSGAEFYFRERADGTMEKLSMPDEPYEVGPPVDGFYQALFSGAPSQWWQYASEPPYGTLLSVFVPVGTAPEGAPRYLLGLDLRSQTFLAGARGARRMAHALTLVGVLTVWLFLRYQVDAERAEADRLERLAADGRERARNQFLGMVSHELRTPVQAILARAGALQSGSPVPETAREIQTQAGDLQRLVEDLLQASALQSPSFKLQERSCRLPEMLAELAATARTQAVAKGLEFQLRLSPRLPLVVRVDELRLRQVVGNLLSNAIKYTNAGHVRLAVEVADLAASASRPPIAGPDRWMEIVVSDSGPGLPVEARTRLFEPFFRVAETAWHPGAGLGLSVAKALCVRLGGDITFRPGDPEGAVFTVRLPIVGVAVPPPTRPTGGAGASALVVEDHPVLRVQLAQHLETDGWRVVTADSVAQAELALAQGPDVVVVDHQLPGGSGAAWIARLKAGPSPRPWCVGMSASLDPAVADEMLASGADDFLVKPISASALREALALSPAMRWAEVRAVSTVLRLHLQREAWPEAEWAVHALVNATLALRQQGGTTDEEPWLERARQAESAVQRRDLEAAQRALGEIAACQV